MDTTDTTWGGLEGVERLSRDMIDAIQTLPTSEVRYLIDAFYGMQEYRKSADNQIRALQESREPHKFLVWWGRHCNGAERQIERALDAWTYSYPAGVWLRSVHGVGGILAANFLAHLDIRRARTAGAFWRFAGLDPSCTWTKGQKRPWNAALKVACYKLGDSFVKLGHREDAFYARMYRERKAIEVERNDRGDHRDYAIARAATVGKSTEARAHYEAGRLPPAQVDNRARRWAVKMFLAHLHHVMHEIEYGEPPPKPYVIEHLGHTDHIPPWNWPIGEAAE